MMEYCLRTVKEKGIEGLEREYKTRNLYGVTIPVSGKELQKQVMKLKDEYLRVVLISMILTLHDELGLDKDELKKVWDRFVFKMECLDQTDADVFVTLEDYKEVLLNEVGLEV